MVRSKRFILPLRSRDLLWKIMDSQAMIVLFSRLLRLRACGKSYPVSFVQMPQSGLLHGEGISPQARQPNRTKMKIERAQ